MKAIVIAPDATIATIALHDDDTGKRLQQMQAAVGGMIELIHQPNPDVSVFVNDDGKYDPTCEENSLGRFVFERILGGQLWPGDWIAGNLLVCGFDARTGETVDLPVPIAIRILDQRRAQAS